MTDTFIDRLDAHGLILWLPPMPSAAAAEIVKHDLAEAISEATDAETAIRLADTWGYALTLKVEHHGPQTYRAWSVSARPKTWAAARLAKATI